jgi:glycosyltransferase involved in cell wall biosynthesis
MKKYKILHIITRWTSGGGAEKNTYFTIKGLNKDRYEVDLIIGGDSKSMPDNLKGVKVIKINSLRRNIHPIDEFRAFFQLYSLIKKNKYDLVHTHLAKAGMLGRLAAKIAGIPIIVHSLHGSLFHNALNPVVKFIYRKLEQFSALYTTWFISVGEDLKFRYLKSRIGKSENYSVIRSGMDLNKFREASGLSNEEIKKIKKSLNVNPENIIMGMVASLEPRKGHKYAIEVAQEIIKKHPKVTFLFVGEGYLNFKLEKIVQEKNLQRCIIFTGLRKDIERVMAVFDILILTSLWEGLPQVLVQGAIMGKPMVSFNVEGSNELIQEGKNGFIVPLKDVPKMIEKLDYLISNLKMAKMMGENGKEIVNQEWEIDNMVEKTNKLYSYLLNGKEQR